MPPNIPDEAVDIILKAAGAKDNNALKRTHQTHMLTEVLKLMKKSNWALDEADFQRTVHILSANGADPVITTQPKGALVARHHQFGEIVGTHGVIAPTG